VRKMNDRQCILLTNDDGVDAPGIHALMVGLLKSGISFVTIAPEKNQSACSMSMTLQKPMKMSERHDIAAEVCSEAFANNEVKSGDEGPTGRIFSLAGTPSDCMIVGLSGALEELTPELAPSLCVSGINLGANVSIDVLHSGTVAGAREASLYGLPSLATSLGTFEAGHFGPAVEATISVVQRLLKILPRKPENLLRPNRGWLRDNAEYEKTTRLFSALQRGDVFLSLNTPPQWNGKITPTKVGLRWYRNALHREDMGEGNYYSIDGVTVIDDTEKYCDIGALSKGEASLTVMSTWPVGHPLDIPGNLLRTNFELADDGWPLWLS